MKTPRTAAFPNAWLLAIAQMGALPAILLSDPCASAAAPAAGRLVVVLYPTDNDGSPGGRAVDKGIRSTFASGSSEPVEVHSEYLDLASLPDADDQEVLAKFLRQKYEDRKIDLVIAGLSPSLDFAVKYRETAFPGVPIVFCAVDGRELETRRLPPDVVGVPIHMDPAGTLDVAMNLHPDARRVFVVVGASRFDAYWEAVARQAFRPYEDKLEFTYLSGLPMPDLLDKVSHLPDHSIVYYLHVFQDGGGKAVVPADVLEQLAARANAPIYGHVDTYVGRGVVGGRVFSFESAGIHAARAGLRILGGEKPADVSISEPAENSFLFDWRQLRRWHIGTESLPPGSVVRFEEPSFWDLYKWHIIGLLALCVIEALLIVGLLVQRARRRGAERRFRQMLEGMPNGMLMVGRDGNIVLANAQMEKLFGYRKEEMLGRPVDMLVPERFRGPHAAHRARFFASPEVRPMGAGRDLFGLRKDGTEFPVEIGFNPVQTETGLFVLASVIDVTERRRAEEDLKKSQRELRLLTGRLLRAQEMERRRIARELHDDLSQNLALLSVELELLGRQPPKPADPLNGRMQELSGRVKQLASSVHGLSHQLHPPKLDQLGLAAAVRSLCKDLTGGHGVPIEFMPGKPTDQVPEDAALCLYRIVQEALRNIIKHSGARRARVELNGGADTIELRIVDDGTGFDPRLVDGKGGLGLLSMRERLRLVGGTIAIDSRPGAGTRIDVRVPLGGAGPAEEALPARPSEIG
jgi:PAS domain S-box-containing protein